MAESFQSLRSNPLRFSYATITPRVQAAPLPDLIEARPSRDPGCDEIRQLRRMLKTRMAELECVDPHIAKLETEILELKEAVRDRKRVKTEYEALRKSAEYRLGRVLLAPYRLTGNALGRIRSRFRASELDEKTGDTAKYQAWFKQQRATPEQLEAMRDESRRWAMRPLISLAIPVVNASPLRLRNAIESVLQQAYENWELIVVDAGSTAIDLLGMPGFDTRDPRLVVKRLELSPGVSAALNHGFVHARGEWASVLHQDDSLEPDALFHVAKTIEEFPEADIVYTDEDKLTESGIKSPSFKPDWSPDLLLSYNYISHFTALRRDLLKRVEGTRPGLEGAFEYDLILRAVGRTDRIHHVPRVLYHGSGATTRQAVLLDAERRALEEHLARIDERGTVSNCVVPGSYRVRREIKKHEKISIIIPTRDRIDLLARCIDTITSKTSYPNYEIIIVDNDSRSDEASAYFAQTPHRVLSYGGPFNYSAINNLAVEQSDSPWLLFLNNDTEVLHKEWLTAMAEHAQRSEVGAVGARLVYKNNKIQHAGVVLGVGGIAAHAFRDFPTDRPDSCRQWHVTRNCSSVTGACLLVRREVFEKCGGFDEERVPVSFSDVDLCLRMQRAGYLIVYTPYATLFHYESATRRRSPEPIESAIIRERWADVIAQDPYYNPNLSRKRADFTPGV